MPGSRLQGRSWGTFVSNILRRLDPIGGWYRGPRSRSARTSPGERRTRGFRLACVLQAQGPCEARVRRLVAGERQSSSGAAQELGFLYQALGFPYLRLGTPNLRKMSSPTSRVTFGEFEEHPTFVFHMTWCPLQPLPNSSRSVVLGCSRGMERVWKLAPWEVAEIMRRTYPHPQVLARPPQETGATKPRAQATQLSRKPVDDRFPSFATQTGQAPGQCFLAPVLQWSVASSC